jgi:hypothetical protein
MIHSLLLLRCDCCGRYFCYPLDVEGMPELEHAERLRDLAQRANWAHILPIGQPQAKDLCPTCFRMPPEG